MKKSLFTLLALLAAFAGTAFAEPINEAYNGADTTASTDTSVVDLSDKDTDQPVQSPSFENTTPAGQAAGQPIN